MKIILNALHFNNVIKFIKKNNKEKQYFNNHCTCTVHALRKITFYFFSSLKITREFTQEKEKDIFSDFTHICSQGRISIKPDDSGKICYSHRICLRFSFSVKISFIYIMFCWQFFSIIYSLYS